MAVDTEAKALLLRVLRAPDAHLPEDLREEVRLLLGASPTVFRPDLEKTEISRQIREAARPWHLDLVEFHRRDPTMGVALVSLIEHGDRLASVSRPKEMNWALKEAWGVISRRLPPTAKLLEW